MAERPKPLLGKTLRVSRQAAGMTEQSFAECLIEKDPYLASLMVRKDAPPPSEHSNIEQQLVDIIQHIESTSTWPCSPDLRATFLQVCWDCLKRAGPRLLTDLTRLIALDALDEWGLHNANVE